MAIVFIVLAGLVVLGVGFAMMPDLPPLNPTIESLSDQMIGLISQAVNVLVYLLTPTLYYAVIATIIAVFTFEHIYHAVLWVLRKIPGLGIN